MAVGRINRVAVLMAGFSYEKMHGRFAGNNKTGCKMRWCHSRPGKATCEIRQL